MTATAESKFCPWGWKNKGKKLTKIQTFEEETMPCL